MKTLLLFGGTTEGRRLASLLRGQGLRLVVSVATEYGRELLEKADGLEIHSGRLTPDEMARLMEACGAGLVVDATHPYADGAGAAIREACRSRGIPLLRLDRQASPVEYGVEVSTPQEAAEYLEQTQGNILLTTGTKDLEAFTQLPHYQSRLYLRILPAVESLKHCRMLGIASSHIMAMQGPFSRGINRELMRQWQIKLLVTKDGGPPGGFAQKAEAAREAGAQLVVIGRPPARQGEGLEEILAAVRRWQKEDA